MSSEARKPSALVSLTATYSDSESDNESDHNFNTNNDENMQLFGHQMNDRIRDLTANLTESRTNSPSNVFQSIESLDRSKETINESMDELNDSTEPDSRPNSPVSYHRLLFGKSEDQLVIPSEPQELCSESLQEKIEKLHEKMKRGLNMNAIIQRRKDFRNPSIYEKLISYCGIDEMATNYPPEVYDPHVWTEKSFYEELAKRQKEDMERREREKKDRTRVEFMSGTKKVHNSDGNESIKKKSKWDLPLQTSIAPQISLMRPQIVIPVTVASGTKPTVISAFGTIGKKSK